MIRKPRLKPLLLVSLATLLLFLIPSQITSKEKNNTHFINKLEFNHDSLDSNCQSYFKHYSQGNIQYSYSDYVFEETLDEYLKKQIEKFPSYSNQQYKSWITDHKDHRTSYLEMEQNLINQTIDTRIYGNCFLKPNHITNEHCGLLQENLFPFLTFQSPILTKFDGKTWEYSQGDCFLQQIYNQAQGQGIVVSAKNSHYQQLVSLLLTLRILNNTLPIQIVHRGDLSRSRQLQLTRLSRLDLLQMINENTEYVEPLIGLENYNQTMLKNSQYPRLDIQFLNIKPTISKDFTRQFKQYSNKLLATLFTTFKEAIIMDADVILFKPPQELLSIPEYKSTGAFFFKDRELINRSSDEDKIFWKKLMPLGKESIFNIQQPSDQTFNNRYFHGFTHLVEAGIVLMDRSTHFPGILHSLQLSLWRTATKRVWGDKELFWLSQAISGTDSYSFNKDAAGAVGELITSDGVQKICSNQPVHLYNDSLLWINSGFKYCKNGGASRDLKYFEGMDMPTLVEKYKGPLNVSAVVVPPHVDELYLSWTKEMEELESEERIQGWYNTAMCAGYTYCAASPVVVNGEKKYGKVVEFSQIEQLNYNALGKAWMIANDLQKIIEKNRSKMDQYLDVSIK